MPALLRKNIRKSLNINYVRQLLAFRLDLSKKLIAMWTSLTSIFHLLIRRSSSTHIRILPGIQIPRDSHWLMNMTMGMKRKHTKKTYMNTKYVKSDHLPSKRYSRQIFIYYDISSGHIFVFILQSRRKSNHNNYISVPQLKWIHVGRFSSSPDLARWCQSPLWFTQYGVQ